MNSRNDVMETISKLKYVKKVVFQNLNYALPKLCSTFNKGAGRFRLDIVQILNFF